MNELHPHQISLQSKIYYRYSSYIFKTRLQCFPESQNHATFRATLQLQDTDQISVVELVSYLEEWTDNVSTLLVQGVHLELNKSCQLVITNLNSPECQSLDAITEAVPKPFCTAFVASTAVFAFLQLIIIITIVTICVTIFKRYICHA